MLWSWTSVSQQENAEVWPYSPVASPKSQSGTSAGFGKSHGRFSKFSKVPSPSSPKNTSHYQPQKIQKHPTAFWDLDPTVRLTSSDANVTRPIGAPPWHRPRRPRHVFQWSSWLARAWGAAGSVSWGTWWHDQELTLKVLIDESCESYGPLLKLWHPKTILVSLSKTISLGWFWIPRIKKPPHIMCHQEHLPPWPTKLSREFLHVHNPGPRSSPKLTNAVSHAKKSLAVAAGSTRAPESMPVGWLRFRAGALLFVHWHVTCNYFPADWVNWSHHTDSTYTHIPKWMLLCYARSIKGPWKAYAMGKSKMGWKNGTVRPQFRII